MQRALNSGERGAFRLSRVVFKKRNPIRKRISDKKCHYGNKINIELQNYNISTFVNG